MPALRGATVTVGNCLGCNVRAVLVHRDRFCIARLCQLLSSLRLSPRDVRVLGGMGDR